MELSFYILVFFPAMYSCFIYNFHMFHPVGRAAGPISEDLNDTFAPTSTPADHPLHSKRPSLSELETNFHEKVDEAVLKRQEPPSYIEELLKLPLELQAELSRLHNARINDPEHYFRIPGSKCNSTDQIAQIAAELDSRGQLTLLQRHKLERQKCLWYTKTYCAEVSSSTTKTGEYPERRCICEQGRTWEDGACLAYHGQHCLWDNDCVRGSLCIFDGEDQNSEELANSIVAKWSGKTDQQAERSRKRFRRVRRAIPDSQDDIILDGEVLKVAEQTIEEQEKELNMQFEQGICRCRTYESCQRTSRWPPFIDDDDLGINHRASPVLPIIAMMIKHMLTEI